MKYPANEIIHIKPWKNFEVYKSCSTSDFDLCLSSIVTKETKFYIHKFGPR